MRRFLTLLFGIGNIAVRGGIAVPAPLGYLTIFYVFKASHEERIREIENKAAKIEVSGCIVYEHKIE